MRNTAVAATCALSLLAAWPSSAQVLEPHVIAPRADVAGPSRVSLRAAALPRATANRLDDVGGPQIQLVYVLPSDGLDQLLDTNGQIATSFAAGQRWLTRQTGGKRLRLDTFGGEPDVLFVRLSRTNATIRAFGSFVRDEIEREMRDTGLLEPTKIYMVYYGGSSDFSCGGGAWPPALPGQVAALYLNGEPPSSIPCNTNVLGFSEAEPRYWEFAGLHEILHTLGFVATCAPHHTLSGHVSDDPMDLMWAGPQPWRPTVLDTGRNDYFEHDQPGCQDLADSEYLALAPPGAGQCLIVPSMTTIALPASGGLVQIQISTAPDCAWAAVWAEPWLHLTKAGGAGAASTFVFADPNSSAFPRTSLVTIGTTVVTVTQGVTAPGPFAKTSPAAGAPGQPLVVGLTWQSSTAAERYEYCYDLIDNNVCDTGWRAAGGATAAAAVEFRPNRTYYWMVRAVNVAGEVYADAGVWSSFGVSEFRKAAPTHRTSELSTSLSLSWQASTGATAYHYCLDTSNNAECDTGWISAGTATTTIVSGLAPGMTYFWQVQAIHVGGAVLADQGSWWRFRTAGAFSKTSPANDESGVPANATLGWTPASLATGYQYCVDTSENSTCDTSWISVGAATAIGLSLSPGTTYFWQVRTVGGPLILADNGAWWHFSTQPAGGTATPSDLTPPLERTLVPATMRAGPPVLRSVESLNLAEATSAQLQFRSRPTARGTSVAVQISVNGVDWQTILIVPASDALVSIEVDLSAYTGNEVQVQFVLDGPADPDSDLNAWPVDEVGVRVGRPALDHGDEAAIGGCTTPDPFVILGGGRCRGGGWLPPGLVPTTVAPGRALLLAPVHSGGAEEPLLQAIVNAWPLVATSR